LFIHFTEIINQKLRTPHCTEAGTPLFTPVHKHWANNFTPLTHTAITGRPTTQTTHRQAHVPLFSSDYLDSFGTKNKALYNYRPLYASRLSHSLNAEMSQDEIQAEK